MSPEIRAAASDLHIRLDRLASRGITHVVHLTVGPSPDVTFRLKTWAEISNTGAPNRNRRLPRWICEELLASIPPNIRIAVDEASSLHARSPRLTLQDLCRASFYPPDTWVALSSGIVAAVMESRTTDLVIHAHHVQRPDGHLIHVPQWTHFGSPIPTVVLRSAVREVQVWSAKSVPHCQEQRDADDRDADATERPIPYLVGGAAIDTQVLFGTLGPALTGNPGRISLAYGHTDT
jgi:hypothetical protein